MYLTFPSCKLDHYTPQCPCDPINVEQDSETMKQYRKAPEQMLYRACGCNGQVADLEVLKSIAIVATQDKNTRTLRLVRYLTRMILDGYNVSPVTSDGSAFKPQRCHWELPLSGIYNSLLSIRRDAQNSREDEVIVANVCANYYKIVDVILNDLPKLLPVGQHADHLRNTVVRTMAILAEDHGFRNRLLLDEKAMTLILTCWTHMSIPNRSAVNTFIHQLYETCDECKPSSVDPEGRSRAVHVLGVDTLVQKFEEWLTNRNTLDQALQLELQVIYDFLRRSPPYGKAFARGKTHVHVMTAMQRQKQHGNHLHSQMVYHLGFMIITLLTLNPHYIGSPTIEEILPSSIEFAMTTLATDAEIREVVSPPSADVCLWHSGYRSLEDMGYHEYIKEITRILEGSSPSCDRGLKTTPFADSCQVQLGKIFIPMSRRLFVRGFDGYAFAKEVYYLWKRLIAPFDMSETKVQETWKQNGECLNPWCSKRGDKSVKMKRCKRCLNVTYCGIGCQKVDWEEHRLKCRTDSTVDLRSHSLTEAS